MKKRFEIYTFGCQMNKSDSELIRASLEEKGFVNCAGEENPDIIIFNTCSVRQHAEERVKSRILSLKKILPEETLTVVCGCMAQRIGPELIKDGFADIVAGPYENALLGAILASYYAGNKKSHFLSLDNAHFAPRIGKALINSVRPGEWKKSVSITHGCGNFCSYCIVPFVRGGLIAFDSRGITETVKALIDSGIREICLLGQNVNQYEAGGGDMPFFRLLDSIARIRGLRRLSFLTSHPRDFQLEIISVMEEHENILKSIHLPLQSGSDSVLESMNRGYRLGDYMGIVDRIRASGTEFSLSTDLIAGFPGETEADFDATLNAVDRIKFDEAFMYAYSPREGTPAADFRDEIPRREKIQRLNALIALQRSNSLERLKARIGKTEFFIPEKASKKSAGELSGKTGLNHPAVIAGDRADIGNLLRIKITGINGFTLTGGKVE